MIIPSFRDKKKEFVSAEYRNREVNGRVIKKGQD